MKMLWQKKKHQEKEPPPGVAEAHSRLEEAHLDDERLRDITRRTNRLIRDNHLAEDIAKALGASKS